MYRQTKISVGLVLSTLLFQCCLFSHNSKLLKFIRFLSNKSCLAINCSYDGTFGMLLLLGIETLNLSVFLFSLIAFLWCKSSQGN